MTKELWQMTREEFETLIKTTADKDVQKLRKLQHLL